MGDFYVTSFLVQICLVCWPYMRTTYVYILSSPTRRLQVGYTDDIRRDLAARRAELGIVFADRLVYYETLVDHRQAIDRYIELKRLPRTRKQWLIEASNPLWEDLSAEWQWGRPDASSDADT